MSRAAVLGVLLALLPAALDATSWVDFNLPASGVNRAVQSLRSADVEFLSASNATVPIGEFVRFDNVQVSDLKERLLPKDPRWDPFLLQVESVFGSQARAEIYVRASQAGLAHRLLEPLGGVRLTLRGSSSTSGLGALIASGLFVLAGLIQVLSFWGRRLWLLGSVIWVLGGLGGLLGGGPDVFWALWAWWVTQFVVRRRLGEGSWGIPAGSFSAFAGGSVVGEGVWRGILGQNFALSGTSLALAWFAFFLGVRAFDAWRTWRQTRSEHAWFKALPLKRMQALPFWRQASAGLCVLAGTLVLALSSGQVTSALPGRGDQARLYWQHCWYQQAVAFGLTWQDYPLPAVLKDFAREENKIVEKDRVEMKPDASWKAAILKDRPSTDVSRLWIQTP